MPLEAAQIIAQELENDDGLRPLAVTLYEAANKGRMVRSLNSFQFSPARRLVMLYQRDGRAGEARDAAFGDSQPR